MDKSLEIVLRCRCHGELHLVPLDGRWVPRRTGAFVWGLEDAKIEMLKMVAEGAFREDATRRSVAGGFNSTEMAAYVTFRLSPFAFRLSTIDN